MVTTTTRACATPLDGQNAVTQSIAGWRTLALLFVGSLALRLFFLAISDNNDGDAYVRIEIARRMVETRTLDPSEIWLPVHFWFLSLPYWLGFDQQIWPRLITALVGAATIPAVFLLARAWCAPGLAAAVAIALALNPLHVRLSIVTVSEAFQLFFIVVALWGFFEYRDRPSRRALVIGATALNLACGQRMEGWVLLPLLPLSVIFGRILRGHAMTRPDFVRSAIFTAASSVFVVGFCTYSMLLYGDPLHIATLNRERVAVDWVYATLSKGYVLAFWPTVVFATIGPVAFAVALVGLIVALGERGPTREFAVLLLGFTALYYFQNFRSAMITDARYSLLLAFLFLMTAPLGLQRLTARGGVPPARAATAFVAASLAWMLVVWGVSEASLGTVSSKLASVSPQPRYDRPVRAVDAWLATRSDVLTLVVGPLDGRYGPWLSRFEEWFPRRSIVVAHSAEEALAAAQASPSAYVVTSDGARFETSARRTSAEVRRVLSSGRYVVFHSLRPSPTGALRAPAP